MRPSKVEGSEGPVAPKTECAWLAHSEKAIFHSGVPDPSKTDELAVFGGESSA